jgi:hypothetical protein
MKRSFAVPQSTQTQRQPLTSGPPQLRSPLRQVEIEVGNGDLGKEQFISASLTQRFKKPLGFSFTVWDGRSCQAANV